MYRAWAISGAILLLCACDVVEKRYQAFSDIPQQDSVRSWLPDFFPETAVDITFVSNLDMNTFHACFSQPAADKNDLLKTASRATAEGLAWLNQQNVNIVRAACFRSEYNKWGEARVGYYIVGKLLADNRYYIGSMGDEQAERYCTSGAVRRTSPRSLTD
ncbi:YbbD family protein [Intestinirhabdus alba]|jgi:hypothetical protein|uniref:YbbD head domain-containing protein n=1 Tax=Intestinirhabdus alba TaxID=2899544 RepID=A0A6L6IL75_9ENTR|nr:hypothetical protein [Intestinirhabdus alba]MTH46336.1 hypothetical protein [Intestinirhabdus alba]